MNTSTKGIIVIADDDPDICDLLEMKFQQSNYEVHTALDGLRALEVIRNVRPDLVILDIVMPNKTGMEVLNEMRFDPAISGIPVILMTVNRKEKDVEGGFALGIVDYITKPFNLKDLVLLAESAISGV